MKHFLFVIILNSFCQNASSQADSIIRELENGVVYLSGEYNESITKENTSYDVYYKSSGGDYLPFLTKASGSGFIVSYNDFLYIVTAEHVARKLKYNATLTFNNTKSNIPETIPLNEAQLQDTLNWYFDDSADVAVLPIHPSSILYFYGDIAPYGIGLINPNLSAPTRLKDIISFGFPLNLGLQKSFAPFSIISKTASDIIEISRFDKPKQALFFILNTPSVPGLSGGPVFSMPSFFGNDSGKLVGLVHGVISDNTGGKFAAIVPSYYVIKAIKNSKLVDGVFTFYYKNGRLWSERLYRKGLLIEVKTNYSPSGKMQNVGTLINGNGEVYIYDENGIFEHKEHYKNGKVFLLTKVKK